MTEIVLKSFLHVRDGRSADAIIADPEMNAQYIAHCRGNGAVATAFELNHALYNLRKLRGLEDYPTTKRTRLGNQDHYQFASEIAARHMERRLGMSLDRIICDPSLATEFDKLAAEIAPGFSSFEYRFTALSLRKKRLLKPEIVARVVETVEVRLLEAGALDEASIPKGQGVYVLFYRNAGTLYVGEAKSLRDRIRKHLDHSDRKEFARWLWEHGSRGLFIELHVLPDATAHAARRALELELIRSRKPRFNLAGTEDAL